MPQGRPTAGVPGLRERFRLAGRRVLRSPSDAVLHHERLTLALALAGQEPAQGAIVDYFFGVATGPERLAALALVAPRLGPSAQAALALQAPRAGFARCSPLATRWSVLVHSSPDQPRRARRSCPDDSHQLAAEAIQSWRVGDLAAQASFLQHCRVCHDTLAFMLARHTLLRRLDTLPPAWEATSLALQQAADPS